MRSDVSSNVFSIPIGYELAIGVVVAGANAGFSRISGVSSPRVAAIYSLGSSIGGMLFRYGVHLGVECLGSALGLSEGVKTGGKIGSELVIGHGIGQMVARDFFHREVTHFDALKLRAGTAALSGVVATVAWTGMRIGMESSQASRAERETGEEEIDAGVHPLLKEMEGELAAMEERLLAERALLEFAQNETMENFMPIA